MFHSMLVTGVTPLDNTNELSNWENQPFLGTWPEKQTYETKGNTPPLMKKPKRVRTAYTSEQIKVLEGTYMNNKYIYSEKRKELAKSLNVSDRCVKFWFQNRRMKEKKELAESSCESFSEVMVNGSSPPISSNATVPYTLPQFHIEPTLQYMAPNSYENVVIPNSVGIPTKYENMSISAASSFYPAFYPTQYYLDYGTEYSNITHHSNNQVDFYPSEYGSWPDRNTSSFQ